MPLSKDMITKLTRKDDQREVARTHKSRWLTPADAADVLTALKHDADEVAIGGQMFSISHDGDKFFLKPTKAGVFVPCGWYTTKLLQSIASSDQHS